MTNNDKLRRIRYAMDISDREVVALFAHVDYVLESDQLDALFRKEDDPLFDECPDDIASLFLQGLVISRRGKKEDAKGPVHTKSISNNDYLKALRIALKLKDEDIIRIMHSAGVNISKSELGALFRAVGQSNYRPCGDQFLRNFLAGLTDELRGASKNHLSY